MKILSAQQSREADIFTIKNEPVSSLQLMERAGAACTEWIVNNFPETTLIQIICGTGNNGGDGLVIARLLSGLRWNVEVFILEFPDQSDDFKANVEKLLESGIEINKVNRVDDLSINSDTVLIDSIFGTGINRPVDGWIGTCISKMNGSGNKIISIDLPSGLNADASSTGNIIRATHTLTFQFPKLAFYFSENAKYVGVFHVLPIGLDERYFNIHPVQRETIERLNVVNKIVPREKFAHKGNFGKSLLVCGSHGKMGAAVLAASACLRSGTGLLTIHSPACGTGILQISIPEAMVSTDTNEKFITEIHDANKYQAIGLGPGIGTETETAHAILQFITIVNQPLVIDADALNIMSQHPSSFKTIPPGSILTPHQKEFERMTGLSENDFIRHEKQLRFSKEYKVIVILKGAHTCITTPEGNSYFNTTGNPGMAKAGSGDILTGMLTAFIAQGYDSISAAIIGVYLHGLAGDLASRKKGIYSLTGSDLIQSIPKAFKVLFSN